MPVGIVIAKNGGLVCLDEGNYPSKIPPISPFSNLPACLKRLLAYYL